ncbi:DUF58 domain-containing protein [Oceanobacillus sp. J11TS1]|uniref:DUF58 domain-containing protein n=1 Tax=Oceanobacillus sp. J11TS1 TaxID=2807191 RepID=UPI001B00AF73|nr:DUF58 domain-containing protein [Oceanobacillus sp. J11TS1]GIO25076.1 hypothetical protein J11TS1_36570 [Oceanobacillus sp. J11TS1]
MKKNFRIVFRIIGVLALMTLLFCYAMFQGGFVSWFLFYSFLPIGIYQLLFACYPLRTWQVHREVEHPIGQAGDEILVKVHIKRKLPFPLLYCTVEEKFPPSLMKEDTKKEKYLSVQSSKQMTISRKLIRMLFPLFRRHFTFNYYIQALPRGEHTLEKVTIQTAELFGFIKKSYDFPVQDKIVVYPYVHQIRLAHDMASYEQGGALSNQLQQTNTMVASGIREYAPGDRVTRIDWKQTARKQVMMTKEFDREKSTDMVLIHDNNKNTTGQQLVYEASIEMSLSLIEKLERKGYQTSFLSIGEKTYWFHLAQNPHQKALMKNYLLSAQPEEKGAFAVRFREEMAQLSKVDSIFLILTSIDTYLVQAILEAKQRTKHLSILYIHSENPPSDEVVSTLEPLRFSNIAVQEISLEQLATDPVEVSLK